MLHDNPNANGNPRSWRRGKILAGFSLLFALGMSVYLVQASSAEALARIPSNVAWTDATIAAAYDGDALRGLLIAKKCDHCHGGEGFSSTASIPNLAAMDRLVMWKQMADFQTGHRNSPMMRMIAVPLTSKDVADLAAYYAMLPSSSDPQDNRSFPGAPASPADAAVAVRLISLGDGTRGIPPCQACHGPVAYVKGAPSLGSQNADYLLQQLEGFASGDRANDINEPMRSIASALTGSERHAIAAYYGGGSGRFQWAPPWAQGPR